MQWIVLIGVLVVVHRAFGDRISRFFDGLAQRRVPAVPTDHIRVATWNLRNFPSPDLDPKQLRMRLEAIDADVLALQEIKDVAPLRRLLPQWTIRVSKRGGKGHQRVAIAYDPRVVEMVGTPVEHPGLTMGGRVRPALSATLRGRSGGPDFSLVVVHLKARPQGIELRRKQWPKLATLVNDLAKSDDDVLVMGDFNATGPPAGDPGAEIAELDAVLATAKLERVRNAYGCSAYWDGSRRDAWKEASLLDLIYARNLEESLADDATARPAGHCARHVCEPFRSTRTYPEPDFARLSDHCPVVVDLRSSDDDHAVN